MVQCPANLWHIWQSPIEDDADGAEYALRLPAQPPSIVAIYRMGVVMGFVDRYGPWAMVCGASAGLAVDNR